MSSPTFEALGLRPALVRNCARVGYTTPSPIQQQAIPLVLAGGDLLGSAQTGTGKTAAFLLPLLQQLDAAPADGGKRTPRVLVLAPTRELAMQIGASARSYGAGLNIRSTEIYGGVSPRPQIAQLARGIDLLVATPGRLLDLHNQRAVNLSRVAHVVLDEADRMLDMGFIHDLKRILALLPQQRQTLLFSATFSPDIRSLADRFLQRPASVDVAPRNAPAERVRHEVVRAPQAHKRALVGWLISSGNWRQVLVFVRTKHGADRLARQLGQDGLDCAVLHGGKTQGARRRALDDFKAGRVRALVATDIAARGLDISGLPHVLNVDLPTVAEDYVHRIGRTGRAGAEGHAVSLVAPEERSLLRDIERLLGTPLTQRSTEGFVPPAARAGDAPRQEPARAARPQGERRGGAQPPSRQPAGKKSAAKRRPLTGHTARSAEESGRQHPAPGRRKRPPAARKGNRVRPGN